MSLATIAAVERNEAGIAAALGILKQRFGERLQTGQAIRDQHAHTTTYIPAQAPDGVVWPETTEEVQEVVRVCAEHRVPVIAFGVGTSLEGHVNAPGGGISLDTSRMNRVLEVNPEDLDCTVEPGVTREELNRHLRDTGLFFPIDPGANASLGGMAATRASGTNAVRYGTMRDNVLSLTAVMADGRVIRTGKRARKSSAGYDLTRLLIGSEGTLGIITAITLKLYGIPQAIAGGVCPFPTRRGGLLGGHRDHPDGHSGRPHRTGQRAADAGDDRLFQARLSRDARACSSSSTAARRGWPSRRRRSARSSRNIGGGPFISTTNAEERTKLWKARHDAYWSSLALRPGAKGLSTDVCVPISRLAECIVATEADIAEHGLIAPIVGHVGDGNFHVLVLMDVDDPGRSRRPKRSSAGSTCGPSRWTAPAPASTASARARSPSSSTSTAPAPTSCARSSGRSTRRTSSIRARYCQVGDADRMAGRNPIPAAYPSLVPASVTCPSYCGRSSVMVNHGALEPTKMCSVGRMVGSSTRVPMATCTKAPSRTTE